ncbi:lipocalin-like domain-containing protein [Mycobacterium sp.]|uniref:lipocalin-like domain-containing protein n=1 Tax=Mycobacterium sp. TaxID=1785 RepID=UPI003F967B49
MTVTTADDLRANLIGAWTLQSYVSMSIDGSDVVYPLGVDARGIIMYTPDGYMSAQLMRGDNAEAGAYFNYAGPYTIVEDGLIAHHVEVCLRTDWIGAIQYRKAHLRDGTLELGPAEPILINSGRRDAKLVWRRT